MATDKEVMQRLIDALDKNDNYEQAMALADIRTALAQPEKEWVGLTDEEILFVRNKGAWTHDIIWSYERAIEAKIKEKNS